MGPVVLELTLEHVPVASGGQERGAIRRGASSRLARSHAAVNSRCRSMAHSLTRPIARGGNSPAMTARDSIPMTIS
jgi:hypothetical protein